MERAERRAMVGDALASVLADRGAAAATASGPRLRGLLSDVLGAHARPLDDEVQAVAAAAAHVAAGPSGDATDPGELTDALVAGGVDGDTARWASTTFLQAVHGPAAHAAETTAPPDTTTAVRLRRWRFAAITAAILLVVFGVALAATIVREDGGEAATVPTDAAVTDEPTAAVAGWERLENAPLRRQQVATAVVDGKIHIAGGMVPWGTTRRVTAYDPSDDTWTDVDSRLPIPLHHAMAVAYRGRLWVIGGWVPRENDPIGTVSTRVYELGPDGWKPRARLRRPRVAGAAAVIDDQIVLVGGQGQDGELIEETEVYDADRDQWRDAAPIPTPREHLAAASDGSYLYAVGGRNELPSTNQAALERYDLANDRWTTLPDMEVATGSMDATIADGRLIVVGGEQPDGVSGLVQAYDIEAEIWSQLPPLGVERHGAGVAAVGSTIYVLNGATATDHRGSSRAVEVLDVPPRRPQPTSWSTREPAPLARSSAAAAEVAGVIQVAGGLDERGDPTDAVSTLGRIGWRPADPLPEPLHGAMAADLDGELVVAGGYRSSGSATAPEFSSAVRALGGDGWRDLPPLNRPRAGGVAAVVGERIVVAGGENEDGLVAPTEVYDPDAEQWEDVAPITTPRSALSGATNGRYLYAAGGLDDDGTPLAVAERFDPETGSWATLAPMDVGRSGGAAAVVEDRLVVAGGEAVDGVVDAVELYDPTTDDWRPGPSLPVARTGAAGAANRRTLFVIGGEDRTPSAAVEALPFR